MAGKKTRDDAVVRKLDEILRELKRTQQPFVIYQPVYVQPLPAPPQPAWQPWQPVIVWGQGTNTNGGSGTWTAVGPSPDYVTTYSSSSLPSA